MTQRVSAARQGHALVLLAVLVTGSAMAAPGGYYLLTAPGPSAQHLQAAAAPATPSGFADPAQVAQVNAGQLAQSSSNQITDGGNRTTTQAAASGSEDNVAS